MTTSTPIMQDQAARIEHLSIRIPLPGTPQRWVHAAEDINLQLERGRITAIVGESGCGKSVLALAVMGLLPAGTRTAGSVRYGDLDLLAAPPSVLRATRGTGLGLIPQSAATHLNPVRTIGATMAESLRFHDLRADASHLHALLGEVLLPPETIARYPHELSGGMAQRVLVALTLALGPDIVVADEPTSALDSYTSGLVLDSLRKHADDGGAVMLITHDLVAARKVADTVAVMYAGRLLEVGPVDPVLSKPAHSYSQALLDALPENGLHPAAGLPSSLVDPDPTVCAWHHRIGQRCTPVRDQSGDHLVACVPESGP